MTGKEIPKSSGFSLLELLVVLVLVGLFLGLAVPNLIRLLQANTLDAKVTEITQKIGLLSRIAHDSGTEIEVAEQNVKEYFGDLDSIEISIPQPLYINSKGLCFGGRLSISNGTVKRSFEVLRPFCKVRPANDAQGT